MTDISKNTELQQSCIAAVKSRFFAQYWGQEVGLQCEGAGKGFTYTISEGTLNDIEIRNDKLLLKSLSNEKKEDKEWFNSYGSKNFVKFNQEQTDFLRLKGYAVPFMEYSVEDLISFGWVQLLEAGI